MILTFSFNANLRYFILRDMKFGWYVLLVIKFIFMRRAIYENINALSISLLHLKNSSARK